MSNKTPSAEAVRAQVDRLHGSLQFAGSERLFALLKFIVDEALEGRGDTLKEIIIGNAVYHREPPYDPRIDSTVRVEARRLRAKLDDYYSLEGRSDLVRIHLPTGGYTPVISFNDTTVLQTISAGVGKTATNGIFEKGAGAPIAILPFIALSRDEEDRTFADGLTDELIFTLQRAPGFRVVSRNTTFQYRDRQHSFADTARELGVVALVQGSVRRDGESLRVTVEVSDPQGFVVWTDRFDAPAKDRMRLQERIAATALSRVRLDSSAMRALKIKPGPDALKALAGVFRARQLLDQQTPGTIREALRIFETVAASAPDYARGHSGIADCHCDLYRIGEIDRKTALSIARPAALAALEIDPQSMEAHATLATIAAWLDWDRHMAETWFRKSLALGENARALRLYGVLLAIMGRHEDAARIFHESREMEPFSSQQDIAESISDFQRRRFERMAGGHVPADTSRPCAEVKVLRAIAGIFDAKAEEARAALPDIEHATANHPDLILAPAEINALIGESAQAERLLVQFQSKATFNARALVAVALDRQDEALDLLTTAMDRRELSVVWIRTDARLDRLRNSPRFQALVARLDAFVVLE